MSRTNGRYDAVLIDFYGTLAAGDKQAVHRACVRVVSELNLPISAADFAIQWGEVFFARMESSNHDQFKTLHECELLSLTDTLVEYGHEDKDPVPFVAELETYWSNPPLHDDVHRCLAAIDVPVCCVSNADDSTICSAIEQHGLSFDALITSEQTRCYKPEPKIFEAALAKMGVSPDRAIHVGDSLHSDIGGALPMGIAATWLCREERIHDIGACDPDFQIATLDELPGLLH